MTYRPFDSVPSEVLSHILTFTWLSEGRDDSPSRFHFPSITTQVDRYFNRTTIYTPILWSYLRVTAVSDLPHIEDRILHRSGTLPLDIYLIFDRVQYQDAKAMVEKTILTNPSRCRTITLFHPQKSILNIPPSANFWDHLRSLAELLTPLPTLRFSLLNEAAAEAPLSFLPPFGPLLRSLTLENCLFNWSPTILPCALYSLSIHDEEEAIHVPIAHIHRWFGDSICHSLRSISLSGFYIDHDGYSTLRPFIVEDLEHFELRGFYLSEIAMLFSLMLLPNLRHLSLNGIYEHSLSIELAAIWTTLRFSNLSKLTLQDLEIDADDMGKFLQNHQHSVKRLEIGGISMEALLDSSTDGFCSQLHEIIAHRVPLRTLVSLVQGRCISLQYLEARFKRVVRLGLVRDQLVTDFALLGNAVSKFRVLEEPQDSSTDGDEPNSLTLEQLVDLHGLA